MNGPFWGTQFGCANSIFEQFQRTRSFFINMIASATYPFPEVMVAQGLPMHIFPAEGVPGRRYFPANQLLDQIETNAADTVKTLFGISDGYKVTIQPHSCTQANQVVYNAVLDQSNIVLSLEPTHGGHISHKIILGRRNPVVHYHLDSAGMIDYDEIDWLNKKHRPRLIIAGGSSYPRPIDFKLIRESAARTGALVHADISHCALFIMTGHHPAVFPYADFATFNPVKNLRGPSGGVLVYSREHERLIEPAIFPCTQGGPLEDVLFAKMVGFQALLGIDRHAYADRIVRNARMVAKILDRRNLRIVTGGTDSHLVLIDLRGTDTTGAEAERRCELGAVLVNRNVVPGDCRPPRITSGVRLGTACISILGCEDVDAEPLADAVADLILGRDDDARDKVDRFRARFMPTSSNALSNTGDGASG